MGTICCSITLTPNRKVCVCVCVWSIKWCINYIQERIKVRGIRKGWPLLISYFSHYHSHETTIWIWSKKCFIWGCFALGYGCEQRDVKSLKFELMPGSLRFQSQDPEFLFVSQAVTRSINNEFEFYQRSTDAWSWYLLASKNIWVLYKLCFCALQGLHFSFSSG